MKQIFIFLSWAFFTFASHYCAKKFLKSKENVFGSAYYLTLLQMAFGSLVLLVDIKQV